METINARTLTENEMIANFLKVLGNVTFALSIAALIGISGCGGGGDAANGESGSTGSGYIEISGNSNGAFILDGAGNQFVQVSGSSTLYSVSRATYLNGMTVGSGGVVMYQGNAVAQIVLEFGADGRKIAGLACAGPAPNFGAMTISVTNASYSWSCASNTSSGGGGGAGNGGNSTSNGTPANQCISRRNVTDQTGHGVWFDNGCSTYVDVSYCTTSPGSSYYIPFAPSSTCFGTGGGVVTVGPGSSKLVSSYNSDIQSGFVWGACAWTTSKEPIVSWSSSGFICK